MMPPTSPSQENKMHPAQPADPLHTEGMAWIPTGGGKAFRPLRFEADGWSELMYLEPGSVVPLHRHTGEVHAYNLSGSRQILGTGEIVGPGDYVYEPAGNVDAWQAVGDEPCVVTSRSPGRSSTSTKRRGHRPGRLGQPARRLPGLVPGDRVRPGRARLT